MHREANNLPIICIHLQAADINRIDEIFDLHDRAYPRISNVYVVTGTKPARSPVCICVRAHHYDHPKQLMLVKIRLLDVDSDAAVMN
jgi:hypothetical protein